MTSLLSFAFVAISFVAHANDQPVCKDLYTAACRNSFSPTNEQTKKLNAELEKIVSDARDKGAQSLGYANASDAIIKRLAAEGIEVAQPVDEESIRYLTGDGSASFKSDQFLSSVKACNTEAASMEKDLFSTKDPAVIRAATQERVAFKTKYQPVVIAQLAKDIPAYFTSLAQKCQRAPALPSGAGMMTRITGPNQDLENVCRRLDELRQQAIDLYRIEGTREYRARAERFIADNFVSPAEFTSYGGYGGSMTATPDPLTVAMTEFNAQTVPMAICMDLKNAMMSVVQKVAADTLKDIQLTRPAVEALIGAHYTEQRRTALERTFNESRDDLQRAVSQMVSDPEKRAKIVDAYAGIEMQWMQPPPASAYKTNQRGVAILDEYVLGRQAGGVLGDDVYSRMSNSRLTFFTTMNADYFPELSVGELRQRERVNIYPALLRTMDVNPDAVANVMAHELGHRLGPAVSRANGAPMTTELRGALACYADRRSIRMQENQNEETIADAFAAELLARRLQRLPADRRASAAMASVGVFCHFDASSGGALKCGRNHPADALRVSGIYGANPSVRRALGCRGESENYKSCGLGIEWPSEEARPPAPRTERPTVGGESSR